MPEQTTVAAKLCPKCGCELEYADCWNICDEGYFDGYEEDPLWYGPGDMYACDVCEGTGYLPYCPSYEMRGEDD